MRGVEKYTREDEREEEEKDEKREGWEAPTKLDGRKNQDPFPGQQCAGGCGRNKNMSYQSGAISCAGMRGGAGLRGMAYTKIARLNAAVSLFASHAVGRGDNCRARRCEIYSAPGGV